MQLLLVVLLVRLLLTLFEKNKAVANETKNEEGNDVLHPAAHQLR
jgi:hypothetical protein